MSSAPFDRLACRAGHPPRSAIRVSELAFGIMHCQPILTVVWFAAMSPAKTKAARRTTRDAVRHARNEVYRRHILEAAERVFAENGFEAAKLQQISKLAGLSMGTIYGVFPGKNELLEALLEERGRDILDRAGGAVERAKGPLAALDALIETYVRYFVEHPDFLRMHLRQGTSWVISPASGANGRAVIWNEIHALQAKIFRDGTAAGVFVDEDPG